MTNNEPTTPLDSADGSDASKEDAVTETFASNEGPATETLASTGASSPSSPETTPASAAPAAASTAAATPTTPYNGYPYVDPRPVSKTVRVGTIVWGLIIALLGVCVIGAALGARIDVQLVFIALLCVAGVALVAGSIITSVRRRQ